MPYRYDVFLSYRRANLWPEWVANHFYPAFRHALDAELGEPAEVFYDRETLEAGVRWPMKLAQAHATSRILVALFSTQYFSSPWCTCELSLMQTREEQCGLSTLGNPEGLVVPARVHDGDDYPGEAARIQSVDLTGFANPFMANGSPKREALFDAVSAWAPVIVKAMKRAPAFDPGWADLALREFSEINTAAVKKQLTVPRLAAAS